MYEPEEFLETLERMVELNQAMRKYISDPELDAEVIEDLARLRDLQRRIRIQFGIERITCH